LVEVSGVVEVVEREGADGPYDHGDHHDETRARGSTTLPVSSYDSQEEVEIRNSAMALSDGRTGRRHLHQVLPRDVEGLGAVVGAVVTWTS